MSSRDSELNSRLTRLTFGLREGEDETALMASYETSKKKLRDYIQKQEADVQKAFEDEATGKVLKAAHRFAKVANRAIGGEYEMATTKAHQLFSQLGETDKARTYAEAIELQSEQSSTTNVVDWNC